MLAIEARAIQSVFFPNERDQKDGELLVGSIKTIIGHTEGTAGLAGVLKASLAVQHGQIPANLHFRELNPKIEPFYGQLRIPTAMTSWPTIPQGAPRRVSVNSFGFGGTNAHAIIENWDGPRFRDEAPALKTNGGLFVISANSGQALAAKAGALASYLQENPNTDLGRLAWTLFQRSSFPFRAAFSATSVKQLADKLDAGKDELKGSSRIATIPKSLPPRILGIFTGQGAQWATMGKDLYEASEVFRSAMDLMQHSLDSLPEGDRPKWSLIDELMAPVRTSRVNTAIVSQPLCTALQVALVNTLHSAGVEFAGVVGHSSGEIAAAYTAGYLDAYDAIRIAYYRGFHSSLAQGPGGRRGKMMAVGMSLDQATRFCGEFGGALNVAASNSQRSCTLAGDVEAVEEAKSRLEKNGTFVRVLAVDTAYHSHHMQPCAGPYLESLKNCGIKVRKGLKSCKWYSSVWGSNGRSRSLNSGDDLDILKGQYWVENLTQTVLFNQAVTRAITEEHCFDLILEIGPHPALKGPASETIKPLTGLALPYSGVLTRGQGAVEAFSDALGLIWKTFPSQHQIINMRRAFPSASPKKPVILKGLPTYPWDHDNVIWHESRASRIFRTQSQSRHELLGHPVVHGDRQRREVHWRQVLKLSEIPWLRGHKILDQFLFPATGYVTMAYEAATRLLPKDQALRLIELHDIEIHKPMTLDEESTGLEVLFILRVTTQSDESVAAEFACYSAPVDAGRPEDALQPGTAQLTGSVKLLLGKSEMSVLPPRTKPQLPLAPIDVEAFYSSLSELGYAYTGDFQAPYMERRLNHAVVSIPCFDKPSLTRMDMHPATLDTAIHGIYAGVTSPGDGSLRSVYLPTRIDSIRVSMAAESGSPNLASDSFVTLTDAKRISGDFDVFNSEDGQTQVQVRGVQMMAVPGSQKRHRQFYAGETWARDASSGIEPESKATLSEERQAIGKLVTRKAFFSLRKLRDQIKPFEVKLMGQQRRNLMNYVLQDLLPKVEAGEHQEILKIWLDDTEDILNDSRPDLHDTVDMLLISALGQNLPKMVRGMPQPLKVLGKDNLLNQLYADGVGFQEANQDLDTLVGQLTHRYPRMKVLELGAGSAVTTKNILASIGDRYLSYTCTDIASDLLPRKAFEEYPGRLSFSTLDIEKDPKLQGHSDASYDLIIASKFFSTAQKTDEAMSNCHKLLRPGGHLMLLEMTGDYLPVRLIKSLLPKPGPISSDGLSEILKVSDWDERLRKAGFSGVDASSSPSFCSVMLSQAVAGHAQLLLNPMSIPLLDMPQLSEIIVVSGPAPSAAVKQLASEIRERLAAARQDQITSVAGLEGIKVRSGASVLLLSDLDIPLFDGMNEERFSGLQEIVSNASSLLWVTSGATTGKNPKATMAVGWGRSIRAEHPELSLQFLDVEDAKAVEPAMIATHLLQLASQDKPEFEDVLWTNEPELKLRDGALYIPRVQPIDNLNRLSNSRAVDVTQSVAVRNATAVFVDGHGDVVQAEVYQHHSEALSQQQTSLHVLASSLSTLRCQGGESVHLVIGLDGSSGQKVLALSSTNGSTVTIPETDVVYRWDNQAVSDDCVQLHHILTALVAESLLDGTQGPTWVHSAPASLGRALQLVASQHKIHLHQTTSDTERNDGTTFIHPYITERDLQLVRPSNVQTFISFDHPQNNSLSTLVRTSLPNAKISNQRVATASQNGVALGFSRATLGELVKKHHAIGQGSSDGDVHRHIIAINEVTSKLSENSSFPTSVIDWNAAEEVTAKVLPPQHNGLFSADKTYILFGLSGDVGISICNWMVNHGARHIVLASRKPNIPASVIEHMSYKGASVHAMAVDISDSNSLRAGYKKIEATVPPVGGVMNGAAFWGDRLFMSTTWADFAAVLAPKVQGTEHLDRLMQEKNVDLEFFTLFSSVVAIAGNAGQTAYAAANLFMEGIVRQRQQRGLPGSVVHIGHLAGIGYVQRHERRSDIETALHQTMDAVSETDLHDLLAEAIMGGRPGSARPAEIVGGLKNGIQAAGRQQPRLQQYLVSEDATDNDAADSANGNSSIKAQLAAAKEDQDACLAILIGGFSAAVGAMLYMKAGEVDASMSVANFGIESLVAIRMREWFLQEVGVEVSVVKVLSTNTSLTELCRDVLAAWRRLSK